MASAGKQHCADCMSAQCCSLLLKSPTVSTGAVPAIKPEATAIFAPQDGRWKITVSFDGRRFCVPKFRH